MGNYQEHKKFTWFVTSREDSAANPSTDVTFGRTKKWKEDKGWED